MSPLPFPFYRSRAPSLRGGVPPALWTSLTHNSPNHPPSTRESMSFTRGGIQVADTNKEGHPDGCPLLWLWLLDIHVDGLAGDGRDDVVAGARHAAVGAAVGLAGTDGHDGGLIERRRADSVDDHAVAVSLQLADGVLSVAGTRRGGLLPVLRTRGSRRPDRWR